MVGPREAGQRLDRYLAIAFEGAQLQPSRSELQRWIGQGRVTVRGKAASSSDRVRVGDTVVVRPMAPAPTKSLPDASVQFDVLYADEAVVVVNKPAGLVVHPAKGHVTGTLVNGLLARGFFEAWTEENGDLDDDAGEQEPRFARPGIVHRLDKDTSGVMVVARTPASREHLKGQFSAHTIAREYVAIAVGVAQEAVFRTLHGRHPTERLRFSGRVRTGKSAVTHVDVLERFGTLATLVRCRLETGRTHQIRVHLAESGHALLGDPVYGKAPRDHALKEIVKYLNRQALHARLLGFVHPTSGRPMQFVAEPPDDFRQAVLRLRLATQEELGNGA
jgi:23S rRNA pseudouridine1911/1915/1917 synthase